MPSAELQHAVERRGAAFGVADDEDVRARRHRARGAGPGEAFRPWQHMHSARHGGQAGTAGVEPAGRRVPPGRAEVNRCRPRTRTARDWRAPRAEARPPGRALRGSGPAARSGRGGAPPPGGAEKADEAGDEQRGRRRHRDRRDVRHRHAVDAEAVVQPVVEQLDRQAVHRLVEQDGDELDVAVRGSGRSAPSTLA